MMVSKTQIKYYSSLLNKKQRQQERKFLVEGFKLLSEAIDSGYRCDIIIALQSAVEGKNDISKLCVKKKIDLEIVKSADFEKLCDTKNPQGGVGVFNFKEADEDASLDDRLVVALENISDPGNMGTIIRNCDWFGVRNVLLSPGCAEVYNPKVIRASAGSVFHLNLIETGDLYNTLTENKKLGYEVLCADLEGENLYTYSSKKKSILVLANEANGPSTKLLEIIDQKITIPQKGKAESLNVASASAVILSELTR